MSARGETVSCDPDHTHGVRICEFLLLGPGWKTLASDNITAQRLRSTNMFACKDEQCTLGTRWTGGGRATQRTRNHTNETS